MRKYTLILSSLLLASTAGCAIVDGGQEAAKTLWGSSTRALENARSSAIVKVYDHGYWEVLRAAVGYSKEKGWVLFKKDEVRGCIVLMDIPGAVNTTEVGVFFTEVNEQQTRIEIASLSTNAKRLVAKPLFHGLDIVFGLAPPDPEPEEVPMPDEQPKKTFPTQQ